MHHVYTSHNVFPVMKVGIRWYMLHDFKWFSNEGLSILHPSHILFLYKYGIRKKELMNERKRAKYFTEAPICVSYIIVGYTQS